MSEETGGGEIIWFPPAWTLRAQADKAESKYDKAWNDCGGEICRLFADHPPWETRAKQGVWCMDRWVVEGMYQRGDVAMIVGEANVGKTYTLLDLAIAVATGGKWLKHFGCFPGPIFYLSGEGKIDRTDRRVLGLLKGRETDLGDWTKTVSRRFQVMRAKKDDEAHGPVLSSEVWWNKLKSFVTHVKEHGDVEMLPRLFVFDPLMALISDVNDPKVITPFIANCRWLAETADAVVILGHHFRKSQQGSNNHSDRIHGPAAFRNLLDNVIVLTEDPQSTRFVHAWSNKFREGEKGLAVKPSFHIARNFTELDYSEVLETARKVGSRVTGLESPKGVQRIELLHIDYSEELDPAREAQEESFNLGEPSSPGEETAPGEVIQISSFLGQEGGQEVLNTDAWTDGHLVAFRTLQEAGEPVNADKAYQVSKLVRGEVSVGRTVLKTRLEELVSWGVVLRKKRGRKSGGVVYSLPQEYQGLEI